MMFLVQFWLMKQKHYKIEKVNNNSFISICDILKSNSLIFSNIMMLSLKFCLFLTTIMPKLFMCKLNIVSWQNNFNAISRQKSPLNSPCGKPEAVNYFCEKASWQLVGWVLNTPLLSPSYFYSLFVT